MPFVEIQSEWNLKITEESQNNHSVEIVEITRPCTVRNKTVGPLGFCSAGRNFPVVQEEVRESFQNRLLPSEHQQPGQGKTFFTGVSILAETSQLSEEFGGFRTKERVIGFHSRQSVTVGIYSFHVQVIQAETV